MDLLWGLLLLTGFCPLMEALRANRRTTLHQPLLWTLAAWAAWTAVAWSHVLRPGQAARLGHYGALCLTDCAGVAVLGARRPGVGAWNFVVAGLLVVLLRPVFEGVGELHLQTAHGLFLGATLAVPLLNYLPTRLTTAAVMLAAGCGLELARLLGAALPPIGESVGMGLLAATPWMAWLALHSRRPAGTEFDRLWLAYRDRFGFLWGQRLREQFNRAATHAGWPVVLRWSGLHVTAVGATPEPAALLATLRAVLKRFGSHEECQSPSPW